MSGSSSSAGSPITRAASADASIASRDGWWGWKFGWIPKRRAQSTLTSATALKFLQGRATGSYALNWDIGQQAIVSQGAAVTYMAQCCGLQVEFQKFRFPVANPNFPIPSDRRINFGFVLAGLGTFSNMFGAFGGLLGVGP